MQLYDACATIIPLCKFEGRPQGQSRNVRILVPSMCKPPSPPSPFFGGGRGYWNEPAAHWVTISIPRERRRRRASPSPAEQIYVPSLSKEGGGLGRGFPGIV